MRLLEKFQNALMRRAQERSWKPICNVAAAAREMEIVSSAAARKIIICLFCGRKCKFLHACGAEAPDETGAH